MAVTPDKEAASEATCLWLEGDFDACLQTLERLDLDDAIKDLKVQHNIIIVEQLCNRTKTAHGLLIAQLESVMAEDTQRGGGHDPSCDSAVRSTNSVGMLNKAILLYKDQKYQEALKLLRDLNRDVNIMDEGTGLHSCVLLLDMFLNLCDAVHARQALVLLEQHVLECWREFHHLPTLSEQQDNSSGTIDQPASTLLTTLSNNTNNNMPHLPFMSKWNSNSLSAARQLLASQGRDPHAPPDLHALLRFYRFRVSVLETDHLHPSSSQGLASFVNTTDEHNNGGMPFIVNTTDEHTDGGMPFIAGRGLKALLDGLRSAHQHLMMRPKDDSSKDILHKLLKEARPRSTSHLRDLAPFTTAGQGEDETVLLNNLGVIHHMRGQHLTASRFFRQAAESISRGKDPRSISLSHEASSETSAKYVGKEHCKGVSPYTKLENAFHQYAVTYNAGVQHLILHEYPAALSCFGRCASMVGSLPGHSSACNTMNPSALIMHTVLNIRASESVLGIYHLRFSSTTNLDNVVKNESPSGAQGLLRQAQTRLETALEFLSYESHPECHDLTLWLSQKEGGMQTEHSRFSHAGLQHQDFIALKRAVHCKLSYVRLSLGDWDGAFTAATQAKASCTSSHPERFYIASYMAEARKVMGHEREVEGFLVDAICLENDVDEREMMAPGHTEQEAGYDSAYNQSGWSIANSNMAAEVANVASDCTNFWSKSHMLGNFQNCRQRNVQLLTAYQDMMMGRLDEALTRIRST
ncbi:hypothetical protein CEUSTIGMA_g10897.t1 [Chlamydomonas eustigma]|uniref:Anaphase-promoting complex subunit 5 n=1 Tax=Chlamydomonas eustigma TaxID=1157962 RepID=A0A250XKM7_9CHLO|nr:hypothetical protein CEUSTIGMA_g10897.t1 [Chlamydomonas eustigma]|eukprot:GAX83472.1 hypothetical protein CEUSTIGMA_g10897.t1 [Chlamydomonas eustigma]